MTAMRGTNASERAGEMLAPSLRRAGLFVLVTYAATWLAALPALLEVQGSMTLGSIPARVLEYAQLAMPTIVAVVFVVATRGMEGLRQLLGQAARWRFAAGYYVYALFLLPAVMLLGVGLYMLLGGEVDGPLLKMPSVAIWVGLVRVAVGEEFGWRGYATPGLLGRFGSLGASLLVGVAWACWHVPFFLIPGSSVYGAPFPLFFTQIVLFSILYTWLYLRTGSLLSVILLHVSQDFAFYAVPAATIAWPQVLLVLLVAAALTAVMLPRPLFGRGYAPRGVEAAPPASG